VVKKLIKAGNGLQFGLCMGKWGAGKTTLVKAWLQTLGVHQQQRANFFDVNEYHNEYGKAIYHFDFIDQK